MVSEMGSGIVIRFEQGDKKLEITIGKEVSPEHLKILQKVLEKLAESNENHNDKKGNSRRKSKKGKRDNGSMYMRVKTIIFSVFKNGQWFTSIDLREVYEDMFGESLGSTTASTYLRRLESEGILESRKRGKILEYRVLEISNELIDDLVQNMRSMSENLK